MKPLSENHSASQMNDSKCFQCNVTKMQEDIFDNFIVVFFTKSHSVSLKILDNFSLIISRRNMIPMLS